MNSNPAIIRATPSGLAVAPATVMLGAIVAGMLGVYAVLLGWPMRIWNRPVSPDTHLVGTLGISTAGAAIYVGIVLALFVLYAAAVALVLSRRARPAFWLVLASGAAFCGVLLPTHPLTSADLFNYIASARVLWVHGANPLTVSPSAFPGDPFTQVLRFWQDIPSPYGPLWSYLTGLPIWIGDDDPLRTVLGFKALAVAFFLATSVLLYLTARRIRPESAVPAALIFLWNPLAVLHVAGNGHNDIVMMFCMALSLYALTRGWVAAAVIALAASVLVKYATLLIVPILLLWWLRSRHRPSMRQLSLGVSGAMLLVVAAYAPVWSGWATLSTALDEGSYYTLSLAAVVRGLLLHSTTPDRAERLATLITRVAFLLAFGAILLRVRGDRVDRLAEACFMVFFAYLALAATYFSPWHVLWPLTFAVLLPFRRDILWPALTLTLTAMSVLVAAVWFRERFAPDPRADWLGMHLAAVAAVFPLPVLVWIWALRHPAGTPERRAGLRRRGLRGVSR